METWSYLILIAALLVLAALMLYARFSSRSRGKLVHHSLRGISVDQFDRSDFSVDGDADSEIAEMFPDSKDTTKQEIRQSNSALTAERISPDHHEDEEYFDELQEAAAGLAMLMRSSPVQDRTTPVVFAPEEESPEGVNGEEETEETILIPKIDNLPETARQKAEEEISADTKDTKEENAEEFQAPVEAGEEAPAVDSSTEVAASLEDSEGAMISETEEVVVSERAPVSLADIVGEEVAEKFFLIDENLDALEALVSGVESRLSAWSSDSDSGREDARDQSSMHSDEEIGVEQAA